MAKKSIVAGQAGVHTIGKIFSEDLGWIFRDQPVGDFGVDAHVEVCKEDEPTGRLIGIQIKYGASYFKHRTKAGFVYHGHNSHLEYWTKHSLPVILILCDPVQNTSYWELISHEKIITTSKGWKVIVPKSQVLGKSSQKALQALADGLPYNRRFADLALAKPWMQIIRNGGFLFLEAEEWINKSSGRGSIRIIARSKAGETTEFDWPYVYPFIPNVVLFYKLFPWADFDVDEDFYHDYDEANFDSNCGIWDGEDKTCIGHTEEFGEWRRRLSPVRPYKIVVDEVAHFRLKMSIGKLGRAFLIVDKYLNSGIPPGVAKVAVPEGYQYGLKMLASEHNIFRPDDY